MSKLYVIGTIHLGMTPPAELRQVLENYAPDLLLLELPVEAEAQHEAGKRAEEMIVAREWAKEAGVNVGYFDTPYGILKADIDEDSPEFQDLIERQRVEVEKYTWQELNNTKLWQEGALGDLEKELKAKYFDMDAWHAREEKMLENIQAMLPKEGTIVILTGAGHLDFFAERLPEAELPFA